MTLTFSHLSADTFESETKLKAGRKGPRHRDPLSCLSCRTRKIRCDRKLPCKPCRERDNGAQCTYATKTQCKEVQRRQIQQQEPPPNTEPSPQAEADIALIYHGPPGLSPDNTCSASQSATPDSWRGGYREPGPLAGKNAFHGDNLKTRMTGITHWTAPCSEIPAVEAFMNRSTDFRPTRRKFSELKAQIQMLNAISVPTIPSSAADVSSLASLLPDRTTTEKWVGVYCRTYGRVYNMIDPVILATDIGHVYVPPATGNPVFVLRILLVTAVAMQNVPSERLHGRGLARQVEDCILSSARYRKPCIGVMQVLLLLIILKTISASDTDKMQEVLVSLGLANQIATSMGIHRDPSLFMEVKPYFAELRNRLWACLLRLNLDYCIRSGTQLSLRLEDVDCPLPAPICPKSPNASVVEVGAGWIDDGEAENDGEFGLYAAKLANIIAPVHQSLHSRSPRLTAESQMELRTAFETYLAELPHRLRTATPVSDPIVDLQRSLISTSIQSYMSTITFGLLLGSQPDISQRAYLLEVWDCSVSVLNQFQSLCQTGRETGMMAYQILWSDVARAAFNCCLVVARLHSFERSRMITTHPQRTVCVFQQMLHKSISFLSHLLHSKSHLGPVTAKMNLLLTLAVIEAEQPNLDDSLAHDTRTEAAVDAAEKLIARIKSAICETRNLPFLEQASHSSSATAPSGIGLAWPSFDDPTKASAIPSEVRETDTSQPLSSTTSLPPYSYLDLELPQFLLCMSEDGGALDNLGDNSWMETPF